MLSEEQIYARFTSNGIVTEGGEVYIPKISAAEFIELCEKNDLAVIGIEGLVYSDGNLIPQLDLIADYSSSHSSDWSSHKLACNSAARTFVHGSNSRENLYFAFVVMSERELQR